MNKIDFLDSYSLVLEDLLFNQVLNYFMTGYVEGTDWSKVVLNSKLFYRWFWKLQGGY